MTDYISFKTTSTFYTNKIIYFSNNHGKNPFIMKNELYIPKEMLREEFQKNFVFENNLMNQNVQNNNELYDQNPTRNNSKLYNQNAQNNNALYNRKPTGLINYGASVCYMNALLQCFYYCYPMTEYFLKMDNYQLSKLGLVSKAYYDFVKGLYSGNEYSAKNFKDALIYTDPSFDGKEGKDSKDLALFILSELNEELKENENSLMVLNKNVDKYNKIEVYNEKINLIKFNKNNTIISDLFNHLIVIEHKCNNNKCHNIYSKRFYNVQEQNIIIFELENIFKRRNKPSKQISIDECIFYYFEKEIIDCPFCKALKLEIKRSICALPNIFIFVMSRGKNAKYDCQIKFKKEIDLQNWYIPIDEKLKGKNTKYNLICATLVYDWYKGFAHGGHTVAICKNFGNDQYYIFNDSTVKLSDLNRVYDQTPYILFYERKN